MNFKEYGISFESEVEGVYLHTCLDCNVAFYSLKKARSYCSDACRCKLFMKNAEPNVHCILCNKFFYSKPGNILIKKNVFCSRKCAYAHRKNKPTWNTGKTISESHKKKLSETRKRLFKQKDPRLIAASRKGGINCLRKTPLIKYIYKGIRFRSGWEKVLAIYFDKNRIVWEYEPKVFKLTDELGYYVPDFFLPRLNRWIEVKGRKLEKGMKKYEYFKNILNKDIHLYDSEKLTELKLIDSSKCARIDYWEKEMIPSSHCHRCHSPLPDKIYGGCFCSKRCMLGTKATYAYSYGGNKFKSSWEAGFAIYCDNHDLRYEVNTREYFLSNSLGKICPSFYLVDSGVYVFIRNKGVSDRQDKKYDYFSKDHKCVIYDKAMLIQLNIIKNSGSLTGSIHAKLFSEYKP